MLWYKLVGIIVALALLTLPAFAQGTTLTGTVTYRERMALPAGAFLQVTLVRLPGNQAVSGAAAAIPAKGGVPIAFSLNLHDTLASDGTRYGLIADIAAEGRVLFRTPQPVQIDLATNTPIAITVQFSPDPPSDAAPVPIAPDGLLDVVWTVTSIGGKPVSGTRPLTLSIAADHRTGGTAGCNNFFTEAEIEAARIEFGPAATTRMACTTDVMAQERTYLAALAAVGRYELDATSLRLLDAAGIPLIGLVRDAE